MAVIMCSNLLSGHTGLDKSVVMTANTLQRTGYAVSMLNFVGPADGTRYIMPHWPIDPDVGVYPLQTLPADNGKHLAESFHPVIKARIPNLSYAFTKNSLEALRQLNDQLTSDDVIIFTHPLQSLIYSGAIKGRPRQVRTIMQIHGDYKVRHPELWPMLMESRGVVDHIQIVASGMRDDFEPEFGVDNVSLVPNIHMDRPTERRASELVNVALIGSFQEAKNQLDAVRALSKIPDERVRLILWGNNATPYGRQVRAYAQAIGLEKRVLLPGNGSEADIYGTADVVIVPSWSEGFGYALVEAAAHRLPVVAYDYDYGPRDVIEDSVSGFIVPLGDVTAMAARVALLADDEALREQCGEKARAIYEGGFSPEAVAAKYRTMLGEPTSRRLDIPSLFPIDGRTPFARGDIRARTVEIRRRHVGDVVEIRSQTPLRNFQIDTGREKRPAKVLRLGERYLVPLNRGGRGKPILPSRAQVLSCETDRAEDGRFYVGNTTKNGKFEVIEYLRRDADYSSLAPAGFAVDGTGMVGPRHPRFPVVSGVDNFGAALNAAGGVRVSNSGNILAPRIHIKGEFDCVQVADAYRTRSFSAPYSYAELFDRMCEAEGSGGLLELAQDGVHPWELTRGAFLAMTAQALGMWGDHFASKSAPAWDSYAGTKRLSDVRDYRRVLFEFPRKPDGVDNRTAAFQDDDTLIIEYPQPYGYSQRVRSAPNCYPIREFNQWKESSSRPRADWVDPGPYEEILEKFLGFPVSLGDRLTGRVQKFLDEREFWRPVFESIGPDEVVIPSSHWSAGIVEAAHQAGAQVSDIQYALTSRRHPSYWFGGKLAHGADRLYAWSDFWGRRTNAYLETHVVPRWGLDLSSQSDVQSIDPAWDVCVVSQPRVFRRMVHFVTQLANARPDLRICLAPHPDERDSMIEKLAMLQLTDRVTIAPAGTLDAIKRSAICVGGYSTSLYEAAALGKPTYVLPVPGHEIVEEDISSGLFRLYDGIDSLAPYDVPASRVDIFGIPQV